MSNACILGVALLGGVNNGFNGALTNGIVPRLDDALPDGMTDFEEGMLSSSLFVGALIGTVLGAVANIRYGRRPTTLFGELIIICGTMGQLGLNLWTIVFFRVLMGVGYGICTVTKPLYVSELCDKKVRGFFISAFIVAYSIGVNLVNLCEELLPPPSSDSTSWIAEQSWRFEIAVGALPAFGLLLVVTLSLPESPTWLAQRRKDRSKEHARVTDDEEDEEDETSALKDRPSQQSRDEAFRNAVVVTFALSVALELTLISVFLGYTISFIERLGVPSDISNEYAFVVSGSHLVGITVTLPLVDRLGRRPLLFFGLAAMAFFAIVISINETFATSPSWQLNLVAISLFVFFFEFGPGATYFCIINEIFPLERRAVGSGYGVFLIFVWCIVLMFVYPSIEDSVSVATLMLTCALISIVCIFFLWDRLPESTGVPLDRVTRMWTVHKKRGASGRPSSLI